MTRINAFHALFIGVLFWGACDNASSNHCDDLNTDQGEVHNANNGEKTVQDDSRAVIESVESMTRAFHAGDIDGVMASYEPSATIVFDPGSPVTDRDEQIARFQQLFAMNPQFTYYGHDVVLSGDMATHFAPWSMRATTPDGDLVEQRGLSVAVLRRQPDGRWLMIIDNPSGDQLLAKLDAP